MPNTRLIPARFTYHRPARLQEALALYLASRLEQTLLQPFPIPFGSSLLVVGGRAGSGG